MGTPKIGLKYGAPIHYSVGIFIERLGKFLLIDRAKPPLGFACVAGHVDNNETPDEAIVREVKEEIGLTLTKFKAVEENFFGWNECRRGIKGHYFYVYKGEANGKIVHNQNETKSIAWYTVAEIKKLNLEPVWNYWFKKLGII